MRKHAQRHTAPAPRRLPAQTVAAAEAAQHGGGASVAPGTVGVSAPPTAGSPGQIAALQRTAGNRAVGELLRAPAQATSGATASAATATASVGAGPGRSVVQRGMTTVASLPKKPTAGSWGPFYTSVVGGGAAGTGGKVEGRAVDLQTNITWGPAESYEGTLMVADPLGPDHPLGSPPGSSGKWVDRRKKQQGYANGAVEYKAGHLLNAELGGPGDDVRNLTPIPTVANAEHQAKVEDRVKTLVNKKHGWVYYKVEVVRVPDDKNLPHKPKYASQLKCEWYQYDTTTLAKIDATYGNVVIDIPPPSRFARGKLGLKKAPTVTGAGKDLLDLHGTAARTKVARTEVVLTSTAKLSTIRAVLDPINVVLDKMQISGTIKGVDPVELDKSVASIMLATPMSADEQEAHKLIAQEVEELKKAAVIGWDQYKFSDKLEWALKTAQVERQKRFDNVGTEVVKLYKLIYMDPAADNLVKQVKDSWEAEEEPRKQTEALALQMLGAATQWYEQRQKSMSVALPHINMAFQGIGQPPIDPNLPYAQKLLKAAEIEPYDSMAFEMAVANWPASPTREATAEEELKKELPKYEPRDKEEKVSAHLRKNYNKHAAEKRGREFLTKVETVNLKGQKESASGYDKKLFERLNSITKKLQPDKARAAVEELKAHYGELAADAILYIEGLVLAANTFDTGKLFLAKALLEKRYDKDALSFRKFYEALEKYAGD